MKRLDELPVKYGTEAEIRVMAEQLASAEDEWDPDEVWYYEPRQWCGDLWYLEVYDARGDLIGTWRE